MERAVMTPAAPSGRKRSFALEVLRDEFSKRVRKNPQYSQRSFARSLGVSHTLLSLILNGHRRPSKKVVERLVDKFSLTPEQAATLLASAEKRGKKSEHTEGERKVLAYSKISLDEFALISEWQHYAILSLLDIADTEFTPQFVAKRLGISLHLAKISMHRLVERQIVEQDPATRKWRQRPGPIVVENVRSTAWSRSFQRQLLGKAVESLENDPMETRDLSSTTFAMHPKNIPYALEQIREFRRELVRELEAFGDPSEVYNLTVQIFPTTRRSRL